MSESLLLDEAKSGKIFSSFFQGPQLVLVLYAQHVLHLLRYGVEGRFSFLVDSSDPYGQHSIKCFLQSHAVEILDSNFTLQSQQLHEHSLLTAPGPRSLVILCGTFSQGNDHVGPIA